LDLEDCWRRIGIAAAVGVGRIAFSVADHLANIGDNTLRRIPVI
jgi:hypothetical protein